MRRGGVQLDRSEHHERRQVGEQPGRARARDDTEQARRNQQAGDVAGFPGEPSGREARAFQHVIVEEQHGKRAEEQGVSQGLHKGTET